MRHYNEFAGLWRAPLFSKAFYQDVALNWRGIAARFLLLLMMLTWLVYLIYLTFSFTRFIQKDLQGWLGDFPKITISKGEASSDVQQPYILKDDEGNPLFVFDTTGQFKVPSRGPLFLMTRKELIQVDVGGNTQFHALSQFPDAVIDRQWIMSWVTFGRNFMIPGGLACCGLFSLAWRLVLAVVLAAIGLGLNSAFRGGLTFKPLMRLAVVSMTGPVLLETMLSLVGVNTACWGFVVFTLAAFGYMVFAVKAAAEVVKPAVEYSNLPPGMPPLPPPSGERPRSPGEFDERFP